MLKKFKRFINAIIQIIILIIIKEIIEFSQIFNLLI